MQHIETTRKGRTPPMACFLSELLGKKVLGANGALIGKVQDLVAQSTDRYPDIVGIVCVHAGQRIFVSIRSTEAAYLARHRNVTIPDAAPRPFERSDKQFLVRDALYDKQIVDVNGARVERVNDVQIVMRGEQPFLLQVDVGFSGLMRRLGFEKGLRGLARAFGRPLKDEFIRWKFVQPLPEAALGPLQVTLRQEQIKQLHAGELADIIEELDRDERLALVRSIGAEEAAEALEEVDIKVQTSVLRDLDFELAADILGEMEPAVAVDVMEELPEDAQKSIMAAMDADDRAQIELLSQADDESAASLMTVEYLSCDPDLTAEAALERVRVEAKEIDSLAYVYCLDDGGILRGVLSLRDVLVAEPGAKLADLMHRRIASLDPQDDFETVAEQFWKYRFKALPVVDARGRMAGIVTFLHSFDELLGHYTKLAD